MVADPVQVLAKPIAQQLLQDEPILRLAYTGSDGGPRVIPIGYLWERGQFLMWTIPSSPKVRALDLDPRVAISIDVAGPPPRLLLVRGAALLETIDGVPDGYLEASHRGLPREAWDGFDAQVRDLYEQMVQLTVTPMWAKLLDFETTAPQAIERLMRERGNR
jgi:hypothetical protein